MMVPALAIKILHHSPVSADLSFQVPYAAFGLSDGLRHGKAATLVEADSVGRRHFSSPTEQEQRRLLRKVSLTARDAARGARDRLEAAHRRSK